MLNLSAGQDKDFHPHAFLDSDDSLFFVSRAVTSSTAGNNPRTGPLSSEVLNPTIVLILDLAAHCHD